MAGHLAEPRATLTWLHRAQVEPRLSKEGEKIGS